MEITNGIMEDLGAAMGFEATTRLIAVFGDASLYVPQQIDEAHPIARVVGINAAQRLVADFGGETINLPANEQYDRLIRVRTVARLLRKGVTTRDIGQLVGLSTKQVGRYRAEAEEIGILPVVLDKREGQT